MEAGHPDIFGDLFSEKYQGHQAGQGKQSRLGQVADRHVYNDNYRLLAKKGKLIYKKHSQVKVDMKAMIALDEIYEVGMKKLKERNLDRDCVVTRV